VITVSRASCRARWTSIDDLTRLSGWQRHTLRGYISTRAAKDRFTVERRRYNETGASEDDRKAVFSGA
jgi:hypothetical protein